MDELEFEKLMEARRNKRLGLVKSDDEQTPKTEEEMGLLEEGIKGAGRGTVSIATTPFELYDAGSRIMSKAGSTVASKILGTDPAVAEQVRQEYLQQKQGSMLAPEFYAKKVTDLADTARDSKLLKGSAATRKGWKEGIRDANWWAGNAAESLAFSGILAKSALNAVKREGADHLKTLGSKTASKTAKDKAKKEIGKISSRAVMKKSVPIGAAMSHSDYRKWEKENPEEATALGNMAAVIGGGIAGSVEGWTIGSHMLGPFVKKFGLDAGTKAAGIFYKDILTSIPKGAIKEGSTEFIQTVIENTGAKLGYDKDKDLLEGVMEAMIIGGGVGGAFGTFESASAASSADPIQAGKIKITKAQKSIGKLQERITKINEDIASTTPGTLEHDRAVNALDHAEKKLLAQESIIQAVTKDLKAAGIAADTGEEAIPEGMPTDEEAFGSSVDPSLTIDEIAGMVDSGEIGKEQWEATPKGQYTDDEIAVIDQHLQDYENAIMIDKMAAGEDIGTEEDESPITETGDIDGTGEKVVFPTLEEGYTPEEAVQSLNDAFKIMFPNDTPSATLSQSTEENEVMTELSNILGVDVLRVNIFDRRGTTFNGVAAPGNNNVLYINESSKRPEMFIFGHEFTHRLKKNNREAYNTLAEVAATMIDKKELRQYMKDTDRRLGNKPGTTTPAKAAEEMLADFVGDRFNDKKFWNKLHKNNPSRFKEVIDSVRKFVADILAKFGAVGPKSDKFFKDMVALDNTLVDVLNEHVGYTGAIQRVTSSKVDTGRVVDLNKDNKHWTDIRLGKDSSMLLREDKGTIYLKRLSRPGSRRGTTINVLSSDVDKSIPTAALNELKAYASANGKIIEAESGGRNEYLAKHGFTVKGDRMRWDPDQPQGVPVAKDEPVDVESGRDYAAYQASKERLTESLREIDKNIKQASAVDKMALKSSKKEIQAQLTELNKVRNKALKFAEQESRKAKTEILDLKKKIETEQDTIQMSTDREAISFAGEQIKKFTDRITELETVVADADYVISGKGVKGDSKTGKQVRSEGQQGQEDVGGTPDTTKGQEANSGDRNQQSQEGEEVKPPKKVPKTASEKIGEVKKEVEYKEAGSVKGNLQRITDRLAKEGKQGDLVAFVEAVTEAGIDTTTPDAEAAYQEAFRRHVLASDPETPTAVPKKDPKEAKLEQQKKEYAEKRRAKVKKNMEKNLFVQMLMDKRKLSEGNNATKNVGDISDYKEWYKKEVETKSTDVDEEFDFESDADDVYELRFSTDDVFISNITKEIDDLKLDTKLPKSMPSGEWDGLLKKLASKGKLNADELEYTYINEWLSEQEGNVKREDILNYLRNNIPKVEVSSNVGISSVPAVNTANDELFESMADIESAREYFKKYSMAFDEQIDGVMEVVFNGKFDNMTQEQRATELRLADNYGTEIYRRSIIDKLEDPILKEIMSEYADTFNRSVFERVADSGASLDPWADPPEGVDLGGFNDYSELIADIYANAFSTAMEHVKLTLGVDERTMHDYMEDIREMSDGSISEGQYRNMSLAGGFGPYNERLIKYSSPKGEYYGAGMGHWSTEDVLAHYRTDVFGVPGDNTLMILEGQSDRHSDVIKFQKMLKDYNILPDDIPIKLEELGNKKNRTNKETRMYHDLVDMDSMREADQGRAPFSNTWPLLIFKNAMVDAYNMGIGSVSWPSNGDQIAIIEGWSDRFRPQGVIDNYTQKFPKLVGEFVSKYGGKVEKIPINSTNPKTGDMQTVFTVKITPQMEKMIHDHQLPQFSLDDTEIDPKDPNPEVEERMTKAGKYPRRIAWRKVKDHVTMLAKTFRSPLAELQPGKYGALKDKIRLAKVVDKYGAKQAFSNVYSTIGKLTEDEFTVFSRNIILADILNDTTPGANGQSILTDGSLPFGFTTVNEVRESLRHFRDQAKKSPRIMYALAQRRKKMSEIQGRLIDAGYLPEELRGNDAYFHHQVLERLDKGDSYLINTPRRAGDKPLTWSEDRTGNVSLYSTDYIISEFNIMSDALAVLELHDIKQSIRKKYDIRPKLEEKSPTGKITIPDGYREWHPNQHQGWGSSPSYAGMFAETIMEAGELDQSVKDKIAGGSGKGWVIPNDVHSALSRALVPLNEAFIFRVSSGLTSKWKQWMLINPFRVIRYNVNNMSGDVDIAMAYDWKILKYTKQAMKDIAGDIKSTGTKLPLNLHRFGTDLTEAQKKEMETAHRLDVIGAGFVMHEITDVKDEFEMLLKGPSGGAVKKNALRWWQASKDATNYRENILRLAAFRYFKDRLNAGDKGVYGASNPAEIDEITNIDEKAAKLSRELIGDYGRLSESGEWIRRHLIPFYSWMEINAPRYVRMIQNVKHEGRGTAGALGKSLTWKSSVLAAKFLAFTGMVAAWNATFFSEEEEELLGKRKRDMHLILGRRADGSIRYLPISGAFRDALSWIGGESAYYDTEQIMNGDVTVPEKLKEMGMAAPTKLALGSRPFLRLAAETTSGLSFYPDITNPRPIRDKFEHVARSMSVELMYRWASGKPTKGVAEEFTNKLTWNVEEGESAYYEIRKKVNVFNERKGYSHRPSKSSNKSTALYYYKQSLRLADLKAAEKYLKRYYDLGGTRAGIKSSYKLSMPTGGLRKRDRNEFYRSLSSEDKVLLNKASKWYKHTYSNFGKKP